MTWWDDLLNTSPAWKALTSAPAQQAAGDFWNKVSKAATVAAIGGAMVAGVMVYGAARRAGR